MNPEKTEPSRGWSRAIEVTNTWIATASAYVVLVITVTITYEVVCRYFLIAPTDWASELNQYLLCAMSMLGGGYCLLRDQHVRVDILYRRWTPRRRSVIELCTWWIAGAWCVVLLWWGSEIALESFTKNKLSASFLEWPLYPSQMMVPLGALLLLLQIAVRTASNIRVLWAGEMK